MAIYRPTPGFRGGTLKLDFIPSLNVIRPLSWQNRTRNLAVQFVSSTSVNWNHWEKVFAPTTLPEMQNSSFANSKMCEKLWYCQHGLVYHVSQSPCAQSSAPNQWYTLLTCFACNAEQHASAMTLTTSVATDEQCWNCRPPISCNPTICELIDKIMPF